MSNDVLKNGYGCVSKAVLESQTLGVRSKAIYMLLCAYKNELDIASPKRSTIMSYLKIGSKTTYYKYMNELTEQGYIESSLIKIDNKFFNNQYRVKNKVGNTELFKDFGFIPRMIVNDKNLALETKVVYAYLSCFKSKENTCFLNKNQIRSTLIISAKKLDTALNELVNGGYILKQQLHNDGKYSSNVYEFLGYSKPLRVKDATVLTIDEIKAVNQKDLEARDLKNKAQKEAILEEKVIEKELEEFETALKSRLRISENIEEYQRMTENIREYTRMSEKTKGYIKLCENEQTVHQFADNIINIMLRTVFSEEDVIKVDECSYKKIVIKKMFMKYEFEHLLETLVRYQEAVSMEYIKNPKEYIKMIIISVIQDYELVNIKYNENVNNFLITC